SSGGPWPGTRVAISASDWADRGFTACTAWPHRMPRKRGGDQTTHHGYCSSAATFLFFLIFAILSYQMDSD
ncbi:hypothetical protein RYX45_24795, partial [Alkalihalophilus pseudofirmus]